MSNEPSPAPARVAYDTTLHIRDHCLCLAAQSAARALGRRFDLALKPLGLTNGQFSLLMSLNRPEPPPLGAVAETLAMDRTTLTAALKPLERRGLIATEGDPRDRRSRLIRLTEAGMALLTRALPIWCDIHAAVDQALAIGDLADPRPALRALTRVNAQIVTELSQNARQ